MPLKNTILKQLYNIKGKYLHLHILTDFRQNKIRKVELESIEVFSVCSPSWIKGSNEKTYVSKYTYVLVV